MSGEFLCPDREAAFRSERIPETLRHSRLLFILSAALNTLFLASDWRFYGQDHFWIAVPARLVVVAISVLCWRQINRARTFPQAEGIMLLWQWVTALSIALLVTSRSDLALFVVLLLPSIYYLIAPTSFRWSVLSGAGCSLLLFSGYVLPSADISTAPGLFIAVLTLNVALGLVVSRSNRLRRLEWAATQAARRSAEELRTAVEAAEQASQAKTQFLAAMSHEIRTPLHGITGLTSLILSRQDLHDDLRRQVRMIELSGEALLTVVNDVLDFSKIEAGAIQLDPMPFWPRAMVDQCAAIVSAQAASKGLELKVEAMPESPGRLEGDEPRLRQILLNLLNNAIKFTPSGRIDLELRVEHEAPSTARLRVAVTDTGIGIPASKQSILFERFSQVDGSTSRQFGGTGLGLAISKQLVELMGGTIGVESTPGEGSRFWFEVTLPEAVEVPASGRPQPDRASPPQRRGRILLAEDVEINQEIATAVLESLGFEVEVVSDGTEAVRAVQQGTYDLVLMDVQMPVMNGITATQHIRSLPAPKCDLPIVAMTANVYAEQVASFKEAGMTDHIGKPFKRDELAKVIGRYMPSLGCPASL